MFIATGENSDLRYNVSHPRWVYDHYHEFILEYAEANDRALIDIWDKIDPKYFAETTFHLSPEGERIKAELLKEGFQTHICSE